jgi:hypothetical protein
MASHCIESTRVIAYRVLVPFGELTWEHDFVAPLSPAEADVGGGTSEDLLPYARIIRALTGDF